MRGYANSHSHKHLQNLCIFDRTITPLSDATNNSAVEEEGAITKITKEGMPRSREGTDTTINRGEAIISKGEAITIGEDRDRANKYR